VIYDVESNEIQVEAIRDIGSGEEITINYLDDDEFIGDLWFEEK
jgi:SET domain-containing protein